MLATMLRSYAFWFLVALVAACQYITSMDAETLKTTTKAECKMQRLWKETGGAAGKPITNEKWFRNYCKG